MFVVFSNADFVDEIFILEVFYGHIVKNIAA